MKYPKVIIHYKQKCRAVHGFSLYSQFSSLFYQSPAGGGFSGAIGRPLASFPFTHSYKTLISVIGGVPGFFRFFWGYPFFSAPPRNRCKET